MAHVRRRLAKTKQHSDTILFFLERATKNPFADGTESDWRQFKDEVLEEWIRLRPGTRPLAWWKFEAPEARRKRLSGAGTIRFHALDHDCNYRICRGLPEAYWFDEGTLDPADPLTFESEASYLLRHKLYLNHEHARVDDNLFMPVRLKRE